MVAVASLSELLVVRFTVVVSNRARTSRGASSSFLPVAFSVTRAEIACDAQARTLRSSSSAGRLSTNSALSRIAVSGIASRGIEADWLCQLFQGSRNSFITGAP